MSIKLDGREVKVGDRVWSFTHGWGTVVETSYCVTDPLLIRWDDRMLNATSYNSCGICYGRNRSLFWDEIKFDIPPPPKKKVKKWQWIYVNPFGCYRLTNGHYSTREEAQENILESNTVEGKLECSVIEVDEK